MACSINVHDDVPFGSVMTTTKLINLIISVFGTI